MARRSKLSISPADIRRIAAAAACDRRTVERFLRGGAMRRSTRQAVEQAMAGLGMTATAGRRMRRRDPVRALLAAAGGDCG